MCRRPPSRRGRGPPESGGDRSAGGGTDAGMSRTMSPLLAGRVAFVTGAGSGIGRAIATRFAEEGADVAAVDLNEASAAETAGAVRALGRRAEVLRADVAAVADVEAATRRTVDIFGRIDILVNNAGITRD